jgi:hypothetical protein
MQRWKKWQQCLINVQIMKKFIYLLFIKILRLIDNKPKTGRDYY